ncbi:MAG: hypothetical protein K0R94_1605 [Burkholderiales bacterium]|jgi:hypothetical protein|nr:hypothetical protein [Burkholderiales bacterium]
MKTSWLKIFPGMFIVLYMTINTSYAERICTFNDKDKSNIVEILRSYKPALAPQIASIWMSIRSTNSTVEDEVMLFADEELIGTFTARLYSPISGGTYHNFEVSYSRPHNHPFLHKSKERKLEDKWKFENIKRNPETGLFEYKVSVIRDEHDYKNKVVIAYMTCQIMKTSKPDPMGTTSVTVQEKSSDSKE